MYLFIIWKTPRNAPATSAFLQALIATFYYVAGVVSAGIALSLLCALLLRRKLRGWAIFRLLFFLPFVTTALFPSCTTWLFSFLLFLLCSPATPGTYDPPRCKHLDGW